MATLKKAPATYVPTQNSFKMKLRVQRGQQLRAMLTEVKSVAEVAKELGVSEQYVRRTECIALAKLEEKLLTLARKGRGGF